jgi:Flp pilus assembly protein TadD
MPYAAGLGLVLWLGAHAVAGGPGGTAFAGPEINPTPEPEPTATPTPGLPSEDDTWIRVETGHFTLYSDASRRRTLEIGRSMERFRMVLPAFYKNLSVDVHRPTLVFVFKHDPDFRPYKIRAGVNPVDVAGYFLERRTTDYIAMNGHPQSDPFSVIYHEFTHHIMYGNFTRLPTWFSEGLAECLSTFQCDDKAAKFGLSIDTHVITLQRRSLLPLPDLFEVTTHSPIYNEGDRRGIFYAESWALVHYLMWERPDLKPALGAFLDRLGEGMETREAFAASFDMTIQDLENALKRYVRQPRFHYSVLKYDSLPPVPEPTVREAPRAEVLAMLGELLAHLSPDRAADAELHFREALRLDPSQGRAQAGLGYLRDEAGDTEAAIAAYETAAGLAPRDPVILYHLGEALLRRDGPARAEGDPAGLAQPADDDRARELFQRCIGIDPDFAEPYVAYGISMEQGGGDLKSAIRLLEVGAKMLPARPDIVANLAFLIDRQGDHEGARRLVETVLARMGDAQLLQWARRALTPVGSAAEASPSSGSEPPRPAPTPGGEIGPPGTPAAPGEDNRMALPEPPAPLGTQPWVDGTSTDEYNHQVEIYNEAVKTANAGHLDEAIALLERLLPDIRVDALADQTRTLLNRMKQDNQRLKARRSGGQ